MQEITEADEEGILLKINSNAMWVKLTTIIFFEKSCFLVYSHVQYVHILCRRKLDGN